MAKIKLAATPEKAEAARARSGGSNQGLEASLAVVCGDPGLQDGGEVARDGGPVQPGHGVTGLDERAKLLGQGRARLDRPLDRQPVGRVELVVEVGGEIGFVVEVHVVRLG